MCLLIATFGAQAKNFHVKTYELDKHGLKMSGPQTFILNKQGKIIDYFSKETHHVRASLSKTESIPNEKQVKSSLQSLIGEPIYTQDSDFTIIQIIYDPKNKEFVCEPCQNQVAINNKTSEVMSKQGVKISSITINMETVKSFVKDW